MKPARAATVRFTDLQAHVDQVLRRVEEFDPLLRRARELQEVRERLEARALGDRLRRINTRAIRLSPPEAPVGRIRFL